MKLIKLLVFAIVFLFALFGLMATAQYPFEGITLFSISVFAGYILKEHGFMINPDDFDDRVR
jgi:hypothetical protein